MKKLLIAVAALAFATKTFAATYQIDPDHSDVQFRVRHLAGHVTGQFDHFAGTFDFDGHKILKASATIDASSVDTKVAARDKHLRSDDFFDVEKYPTISFVSTKAVAVKNGKAKLPGKLTITDTTKAVVLDIDDVTVQKGMDGKQHVGLSAKTKVNRQDYGLTWSAPVEAGGVLVGDEIEITLDVEGIITGGK